MNLVQKTIYFLISNEIIKDEDKDIYEYGIKQGLLIILNVFTTIIIGCIFNMVWESILFTIFYVPLRTYAGGYHAKTQGKCYFYSVILIIFVLLSIKYISWNTIMVLISAVISIIIIIKLAPIEDKNKPLSDRERVEYEKWTRKIVMINSYVLIVSVVLDFYKIQYCICLALITMSIMLMAGLLNNKR